MKTIDDNFIIKNRRFLSHKKCVFIVGAGISVASGIPDFRSPNGIFSLLRQQLRIDGRQLFSYNFGIKEGTREIYLKYIADLKKLCDSSQPNAVHRFLSAYPSCRVYTQNIDGLEERAGMAFSKTDSTRGVYLHGNLQLLQCRYCGYKEKFGDDAVDEFSKGLDKTCSLCIERREKCIKNNIRKRPVGVMHPGIIHYQQAHPDGAFIGRMMEKDGDCDLLIVIGTSLKVEGIKKMVKMFAKYPGVMGKRIFVNLTRPTKEWEQVFDYFYEGDCSDFISSVETGVPRAASDNTEKVAKICVGKNNDNSEEKSPILENTKYSERSNSPDSSLGTAIREDKDSSPGQIAATAKISLDLKRASLKDVSSEKHSESYLSEERYDERLLKENISTKKTSLLDRIEALGDAFDNEDVIRQPILDNVVKLAVPTSILPPETCSATEFVQGLPDSSCADLEEEFNRTFSDTVAVNTEALEKASSVALTPKKKTKRKASKH